MKIQPRLDFLPSGKVEKVLVDAALSFLLFDANHISHARCINFKKRLIFF